MWWIVHNLALSFFLFIKFLMSINLIEQLSDAGKKLEEAKLGYLEVYYTQINKLYLEGGSAREEYVHSRLEKLIDDLKGDVYDMYSFEIAKKIRIKNGYKTQEDLGKFLGVGKQLISLLERDGKLGLNIPRRGTKGMKYLLWLKEKGYNPFGI